MNHKDVTDLLGRSVPLFDAATSRADFLPEYDPVDPEARIDYMHHTARLIRTLEYADVRAVFGLEHRASLNLTIVRQDRILIEAALRGEYQEAQQVISAKGISEEAYYIGKPGELLLTTNVEANHALETAKSELVKMLRMNYTSQVSHVLGLGDYAPLMFTISQGPSLLPTIKGNLMSQFDSKSPPPHITNALLRYLNQASNLILNSGRYRLCGVVPLTTSDPCRPDENFEEVVDSGIQTRRPEYLTWLNNSIQQFFRTKMGRHTAIPMCQVLHRVRGMDGTEDVAPFSDLPRVCAHQILEADFAVQELTRQLAELPPITGYKQREPSSNRRMKVRSVKRANWSHDSPEDLEFVIRRLCDSGIVPLSTREFSNYFTYKGKFVTVTDRGLETSDSAYALLPQNPAGWKIASDKDLRRFCRFLMPVNPKKKDSSKPSNDKPEVSNRISTAKVDLYFMFDGSRSEKGASLENQATSDRVQNTDLQEIINRLEKPPGEPPARMGLSTSRRNLINRPPSE